MSFPWETRVAVNRGRRRQTETNKVEGLEWEHVSKICPLLLMGAKGTT
jgi:hypothetical protein